jgi:uncharacterized protein (TIGR02466 family)
MKTNLTQLFATPIYEHVPKFDEIFLIQKEISEILETIRKNDKFENPFGWNDGVLTNIKQRLNMIDHYQLKNLKSYVEKHTRLYISFIKAYENKNLFLSHSWMNITKDGTFQDSHQHQDSVISGVYYFQTNQKDGNITFETPNPYMALELFPFGQEFYKYFSIIPSVGKIVIFPGWLKHQVEKNNTLDERISISFNYLYDNSKEGHKGTYEN